MRRLPEQERSKATMTTLMLAAAELFGREGIDAVSMTQIAKQAGMSKPALYRYFPSKQAIVHQLAEQSFADSRDIIILHLAKLDSVDAPLDANSLKQALTMALSEYCQLHRKEPYRVKLRAAIHADPLLAASDIQDSRENAELLTTYLLSQFPDLKRASVQPKMLLLAELSDSLVRLTAKVDERECEQLIAEYVNLFIGGLFI